MAVQPASSVRGTFEHDVRAGLLASPRRLPSHYFYDELGSALFDAICRLPWYEVTRAEVRLLTRHAAEIGASTSPSLIVELGPGNGDKLARLLRGFAPAPHRRPVHLIDVSAAALGVAARTVGETPQVSVTTDRATYHDGLRRLGDVRPAAGPVLVCFLGSNIGNFDPQEAQALLRDIRAALSPGDRLLLGTDLVKPEDRLLLAYDDPLGVTAAFNRNLLVRLNRELRATFDLSAFSHRAVWNAAHARVEMYLVAERDQEVDVPAADLRVTFRAGDTIWTESSYKYEAEELARIGAAARFAQRQQWIDEPGRFALTLFTAA